MNNAKFFEILDSSNEFIRENRITRRRGVVAAMLRHLFDVVQGSEWKKCADKINTWINTMRDNQGNGYPTASCPERFKFKMNVSGGALPAVSYFDSRAAFDALRTDNTLFQSVTRTA